MSAKIKKSSRRATILRWAGTILTTGLFIGLVAGQKWDVVLQKASGISPWAVLLAIAFFIVSWGFNTLRWCSLLWAQDVKITFWQAFCLVWAGTFASNVLISTIGGDGFRMVGILRYTERKAVAIGSVILDRIINVVAMTCLIPVPFLIFGSSLIVSPRGAVFSDVAVSYYTNNSSYFRGLLRRWGTLLAHCPDVLTGMTPIAALILPEGLRKLFERYFLKVAGVFQAWASRPWAFVYAFLAAWPSNLLPMAATWLIAHQLGMTVSFWQVIGVQTVTYFVSQLPSINGYGFREATYTTLYTALGASLEQASTLALVTRLISVVATVPGALWLTGSVTDVALRDTELDDETDPGRP